MFSARGALVAGKDGRTFGGDCGRCSRHRLHRWTTQLHPVRINEAFDRCSLWSKYALARLELGAFIGNAIRAGLTAYRQPKSYQSRGAIAFVIIAQGLLFFDLISLYTFGYVAALATITSTLELMLSPNDDVCNKRVASGTLWMLYAYLNNDRIYCLANAITVLLLFAQKARLMLGRRTIKRDAFRLEDSVV